MKYTEIYTLLTLIILFILSSCQKYLDKKSDTSLVVPSSISNFQGLLDNTDAININTPIYGETSSDDYFLPDENYDLIESAGLQPDAGSYTWTPVSYDQYPNDWSMAYSVIYTTNLCLEGIEKINRTTDNMTQWDNIKGSALFLRAYYNLKLAWDYSLAYDANSALTDLGIVLRLGSDFNVESVRSNVQQTYDQIISDAKDCINYLPDYPPHPVRPSKAAGYGLLARIYLSMRLYDSAYKYSNMCLSLQNDLLDYNNISEVDVNSITPFAKFNKETIFYSEGQGYFLLPARDFLALADTLLYESYEVRDLRKSAFFTFQGSYYQFKNSYAGSGQFFTGIAVDEMFLTRAECYARLGLRTNALADLNAVVSKRWETGYFNPVTVLTDQQAVDTILVERRKELLRRGLRWIDIKRLNKEGAAITLNRNVHSTIYSLEPNDPKFALPLPKDIIDITGIPQN